MKYKQKLAAKVGRMHVLATFKTRRSSKSSLTENAAQMHIRQLKVLTFVALFFDIQASKCIQFVAPKLLKTNL